ncbi:GNAT family N-acetyltransferase [Vagococcus hydrophili]|uniref:N-acetyltransferase n=1 Tax=Vagococcus hydrophili TaxID=2714947 RepID=A0A6G8AXD7_9ENTE|nr:N-acetyltransferase [Vagococcus hydrophili]QIL49615.1 N-acetyltransferase [Vagococcus hydrophili]
MIRQTHSKDYETISKLTIAAFKTTEFGYQGEAELIEKIRNEKDYDTAYELVALTDEKILGHGLLSRCYIEDDSTQLAGLSLAPLSVDPDYQKQGIGSKLMLSLEKAASENGEPFIVILGHPEYYSKFGYTPASNFNVKAPFDVPDEFFMIKELQKDSLNNVYGTVKYSKAFE